MAGRPFTGHLNSQMPQPTHFLRSTCGSCASCGLPLGPGTISLWKNMAFGDVGQCSSHTMQGPFPDQGRHLPRSMYAEPIIMGFSIFSLAENFRMAPVGQTSPHRVQVYSQYPWVMMRWGVQNPAIPASVRVGLITLVGQAFMHRAHR